VRGLRTDEWKFIRYPHGDGTPDRHLPELYNLANDPGELHNLAALPQHATTRAKLEAQLAALLTAEGLTPDKDKMPLDQGIKPELPNQNIR
jgi:N-acetylglucosamine-6-sulfatase